MKKTKEEKCLKNLMHDPDVDPKLKLLGMATANKILYHLHKPGPLHTSGVLTTPPFGDKHDGIKERE